MINSNPSPSIKIAIYEMQAANNNKNDDDDAVDDADGDEGAQEANTAATHVEGLHFYSEIGQAIAICFSVSRAIAFAKKGHAQHDAFKWTKK